MSHLQSRNIPLCPHPMDNLSPLLTSQSTLQMSRHRGPIKHPTRRTGTMRMERTEVDLRDMVMTRSTGTRVARRQTLRKTKARVVLQQRRQEMRVLAKEAQP